MLYRLMYDLHKGGFLHDHAGTNRVEVIDDGDSEI